MPGTYILLKLSKDAHDGNAFASWDGFAPVKHVRGAKRCLVYVLPSPPHSLSSSRVTFRCTVLSSLVMPEGVQPSPVGDLATFAVQLDRLRADQNSDVLSDALRAAFEQHELYEEYFFSLHQETWKFAFSA